MYKRPKCFTVNKTTYWQVEFSGATPKIILCPRCNLSRAFLSFKIEYIKPTQQTSARIRKTYLYACPACGLEHQTASLLNKNKLSLIKEIKDVNSVDFMVSILRVHNRKGFKSIRQTADFIEKNLHIKRGWVSKKLNQTKQYKPVNREIIEDITALAMSL